MQLTAPRLFALGVLGFFGYCAHQVYGVPQEAGAAVPGIDPVVMTALVEAVESVPDECGLTISLLGGISSVESLNGTIGGSRVQPNGMVEPPIRGPQLSPGSGFAVIPDSDNGRYDGDTEWDRAVGPMQFLPGTWLYYADEDWDPQNYFHATKATARMMCAVALKEGRPLTDPDVEEAAILAYNYSMEYVEQVRGFKADFEGAGVTTSVPKDFDVRYVTQEAGDILKPRWQGLSKYLDNSPSIRKAYDAVDPAMNVVWNTLGATTLERSASLSSSESDAGMVTVMGITVAASIADDVERMLRDAEEDGIYLTGSGYRSHEEQIWLRQQHCGGSDSYSVYERPPGECSPPTAIPGTSNHETGLAIDFRDGDGNTVRWGSPEFEWLADNAHKYGLYNLPSEAWHWSVDAK